MCAVARLERELSSVEALKELKSELLQQKEVSGGVRGGGAGGVREVSGAGSVRGGGVGGVREVSGAGSGGGAGDAYVLAKDTMLTFTSSTSLPVQYNPLPVEGLTLVDKKCQDCKLL